MGKGYARLDPFARGQVIAFRKAGVPMKDIVGLVRKKDGQPPSQRAVEAVLEKAAADPTWRGEDSSAGGRPPKLSAKTKKALLALVVKERGSYVVTTTFCRKRLPALRKVSAETVRRALHEAGLAWLRRRVKRAVPKSGLKVRMGYARKLLRRKSFASTAYTDGTTFYLARSAPEHEDKKRAALGVYVWRMSSGKDGLFTDNVGPSLYAASQGRPVKIWGMLAKDKLCYHVSGIGSRKFVRFRFSRGSALGPSRF